MMDNGQPDQKRPRIGPGPWNNPNPARELPQPLPTPTTTYQHGSPFSQPQPQPHPLDDRRRHPAHIDHQPYDPDPRRPNSGPSHVYHPGPQPPPPPPPYGGRPETMVKRDPSDEPSPLQYRPSSTGGGPDHNVAATHPEERRGAYLPAFEPSGQHAYRPPPSYPPQSPMPVTEPYTHPAYGTSGLQAPRQDMYPGVSYPSVLNTAKRKAQRAAQACDSCRSLKAKCDEGRPYCSSCKEKGISCVYRDPPPKQQDKASADIMEGLARLESSMSSMSNFQSTINMKVDRLERFLMANNPSAEASFKEEVQEIKPFLPSYTKPSVSELQSFPSNESPYSSTTSQPRAPERAEPEDEEEEAGEPVAPGQPSIPVNHTTGAARLLLVGPIAQLAQGIIVNDKIKNEKYPMLQEERRGLLRVYGRGEGTERLPGYDKDPLIDYGSDSTTPSDTSSDVSSPAGEEWGQLGGLTPPGEPLQRGPIGVEGMPDLDRLTVLDLVDSYKRNMNNMHPILVPRRLDMLVDGFLKSIPDNQPKPRQVTQLATSHHSGHVTAGFVQSNRNPESPGNKRKRSPGSSEYPDVPSIPEFKPGHPYRSIGTAIVLLVMALGKVCLVTGKIPDCVDGKDNESSWNSPTIRNGHPPSPLQSSPALSTMSGLPSPIDREQTQPRSRRTSIEGVYQVKGITAPRPRNLDIIPGLAYFAPASDILGNQAGGNSLQHVHANILASLYHGQLGRILESHSYLHQACRSLQVILRPKLDRFKKLKAAMDENPRVVVPQKDNPLIFAFWTCLQLESDIVAELPVPHSGILTYEEDMPSPNLQAAADLDGFDPLILESYSAQLYLRKHLNQVHNMFYKPVNDSEYPVLFNGKSPHHFPTIDASLESLDHIHVYAPNMKWSEEDPPAMDILRARLRAKYYGAKVITYRHFILKILEHSAAGSTKKARPQTEEFSEGFKTGIEDIPRINADAKGLEDIDLKIHEYASNCIKALIKSTTAFYGLGDPGEKRLIVTNIWGTAHAQWGNLLTLQAAYADPILKPLINRTVLKNLLDKTIAFLKLVAQPSSALSIDYRILEHVGGEIGLLPKKGGQTSGASFSSTTSGDVPMTGH